MCSPKNSCNKGVAMVKPPSLIVRESGILNLTLPMNLIADKYRTSTIQVQDKLIIENENIKCVIEVVGNQPLSMKSIMQALGLKSRDHFLKRYLRPAIDTSDCCIPTHPAALVRNTCLPKRVCWHIKASVRRDK